MAPSSAAFCSSLAASLFHNYCNPQISGLNRSKSSVARRTPFAAANIVTAENPNTGVGATPRYVSSTSHPDLRLHTLTWPAAGKPIAGLLISPGLVWHSGWFAEIGLALSAAGCTTVALDGIGMGRSDNLRGHKCFITNIQDHIQDLGTELRRMEAELPEGTPLFILGESSGGLTASLLALNEDLASRVSAYILCAPAIRVKEEVLPPAAVVSVLKLLARFLPELPAPGEQVSGDTWDIAFGDTRYAELSKSDPLVGYGVPMRLATLVTFLDAMDSVENALQQGKLKMPNLLVLHNREDARTDYAFSERLVQRVVCDDSCDLVEPGGTGHQVFQDLPEITNDVVRRIVTFVSGIAEKESSKSPYC